VVKQRWTLKGVVGQLFSFVVASSLD